MQPINLTASDLDLVFGAPLGPKQWDLHQRAGAWRDMASTLLAQGFKPDQYALDAGTPAGLTAQANEWEGQIRSHEGGRPVSLGAQAQRFPPMPPRDIEGQIDPALSAAFASARAPRPTGAGPANYAEQQHGLDRAGIEAAFASARAPRPTGLGPANYLEGARGDVRSAPSTTPGWQDVGAARDTRASGWQDAGLGRNAPTVPGWQDGSNYGPRGALPAATAKAGGVKRVSSSGPAGVQVDAGGNGRVEGDAGFYDIAGLQSDSASRARALEMQRRIRNDGDAGMLALLSGSKSMQPVGQALNERAGSREKMMQDSGDSRLKNAMERQKLAEARRHNIATEGILSQKASMSVHGAFGAGEPLDEQTVEMLAHAFGQRGDPSVLGFLPRNHQGRVQVATRAAQLGYGDLAGNLMKFNADKGSLAKNVAQTDKLGAYSKMVDANLGLLESTLPNIMDSGSPLLNAPLRGLAGTVLGDEDQAKFKSALTVARTEASRILNNPDLNGVVSDDARHELQAVLGDNFTVPQLQSVIGLIRVEKANREKFLNAVQGDITSRVAARRSDGAPAAAPKSALPQATAKASGTAPAGGKIRVRHKASKQTGTLDAADFNPDVYEKI